MRTLPIPSEHPMTTVDRWTTYFWFLFLILCAVYCIVESLPLECLVLTILVLFAPSFLLTRKRRPESSSSVSKEEQQDEDEEQKARDEEEEEDELDFDQECLDPDFE